MTHSYTGANAYPTTIPLMEDSDSPTAAAFSAPLESLADRTTYLKQVSDGTLSSQKCYTVEEAKALTSHPTNALIVIKNYGVYRFSLTANVLIGVAGALPEPYVFALDDMSGYWVHQGVCTVHTDNTMEAPIGFAPIYDRDRHLLSYNQVPNFVEMYTVMATSPTGTPVYIPYTGQTGAGAVASDGTEYLIVDGLSIYEGTEVHCAANLCMAGATGPCGIEYSFSYLDLGSDWSPCGNYLAYMPTPVYYGPMHYEDHYREPTYAYQYGYPQNYMQVPFFGVFTAPYDMTDVDFAIIARSMTPGFAAAVWGSMQLTVVHKRGKP